MSEENKLGKTNFWLGFFAGVAIVAVIAFFALLVIVFSGKGPATPGPAAVVPSANEPAAVQPTAAAVPGPKDGEKFLGGKDASVVLIEYTDMECPYCLKNHVTIKQILSTYGDKVKYIVRHFPLSFHPEAEKAAEAVECATLQDKRFEMVDYVFNMNEAGTMSVASWKAGAKKLGLNTTKFDSCLDDGTTASIVSASAQEGGASGVDGTPATFINGQLVSGALPFESFKGTIDPLLK